ncbi:carbamoyl-phosphate synthase large subunit [Candidatus Desantisbacteria bacterium]|nr:carbamoyl-phosphate synthase large subunit [Candidatus Desantisbacteria bacterium]
MPRRQDLKKILIIGSGPIVIGQACEFDYSGTQACKALKEEGYEIILINSNPATIMTDPEMANRTYIEPITKDIIEKIIERERPDAILPTIGGQTALNVTVELADAGVLEKYNVEMIGAKIGAIKKAEDRKLFKKAMENIGVDLPESDFAYNIEDAYSIVKKIGYPAIIRPSFTLGGTGGGIAYNIHELEEIVSRGIEYSPIGEVLVEESVIGWKEFELEVMRDLNDNVVIICSIENFDPMGVHTGDSITVAPAQTLTDKEYQIMRDAAIKIIREIGVDTGGSNIQFALNPRDGRMVIIEMNPRVSRSSALASKATGFPIAKIAAKLAVGYTLNEIPNDITRETLASFEPTIDYCVVKIPRWAFEKFPEADDILGTQMKSVGETMAIGRTFKEALQKGLRSLEIGRHGLGADGKDKVTSSNLPPIDKIEQKLKVPNWERIFYIRYAMKYYNMKIEEIYKLTWIDPWFLYNIMEIIEVENLLEKSSAKTISEDLLRKAKEYGFSDNQLAYLLRTQSKEINFLRVSHNIKPVFKTVDTCAAEFEAYTPYYYSTYDKENEAFKSDKKKIIILGSGPNRIGQGIEFDYCCVHACFALAEDGYETIMINSNPETVSTDYDTSTRLYFEPLTFEDVMNIIEHEEPDGVIVQFGGQTPLKLAIPLERAGVNIIGTSPDSIDLAEDRGRFSQILDELKIPQPPNGVAFSFDEARSEAKKLEYPILVRPSYVLGGRAMKIVYDEDVLKDYMLTKAEISPEHPILIDKFLEEATEVDVDAVCDGTDVVICGIMEHIEEAGIHSGDSACVMPPFSLAPEIIKTIREYTNKLAYAIKVKGLMNIQYAVKKDIVYVLEVNPRASRTVPFVSKTTGIPWAKIASRVMCGKTLKEMRIPKEVELPYISVKEVVFPFIKFPGVDTLLGPEMKSTGEVMGIDSSFGRSFAKSQISAGQILPKKGTVFISVNDRDKHSIISLAKKLTGLGFEIIATKGTAQVLNEHGIKVIPVLKVVEGRPNIVDKIKNGEVHLIINTPFGKKSHHDSYSIRRNALIHSIPIITTISGASAAISGIESLINEKITVKSIQEFHKEIKIIL